MSDDTVDHGKEAVFLFLWLTGRSHSCLRHTSRFDYAMNALWFLAPALSMAFLVGCSTVESRIRSNEALFADLPSLQRSLVLQGKVEEGMTKDAVFLAWGDPAQVAHGSVNGRSFEEWRYFIYAQEPVSRLSSIPVLTSDGRYFLDYVYDPAYVTQRRPWKRAVFEEGKVVSWESIDG